MSGNQTQSAPEPKSWIDADAFIQELTGYNPSLVAYCMRGEDDLIVGLFGVLLCRSHKPVSAGNDLVIQGVNRLVQRGRITTAKRDSVLGLS